MAIVTIHIAASGGDYTSLATALSAEAKDLVAAGDSYIFDCTGILNTSAITMGAEWTTDSTHTITIQATGANRHTGKRGTGFRIVGDFSWSHAIRIMTPYVTLDGIAVSNIGGTSNQQGIRILDAAGVKVLNCLVYDTTSQGFSFLGSSVISANCVSISCGIGFMIGNASGYTFHVYNATALTNGYGFYVDSWGTVHLTNNYAGGSVTEDYHAEANAGITYTTCHSEDGTGTTTTTSIASCNFTNVTSGSEDINITAGSALATVGTDLHEDTSYAFSTDYAGTARPNGSWCVGAMQLVSAAFAGILKRWNGAAWVKANLKRYDGATFVTAKMNVYKNGTFGEVDTNG
jgi:hypothetical protein